MVHGGSLCPTRRADPRAPRRARTPRFVECVVCLKRVIFFLHEGQQTSTRLITPAWSTRTVERRDGLGSTSSRGPEAPLKT
eukprot:6438145-Prymnesium_polylepis.1